MDTPLNSQYLKKYFTAGKIGLDYNYAVKRQIFFKPATVQYRFFQPLLYTMQKKIWWQLPLHDLPLLQLNNISETF